ncbi:MAG TPA: hypothetical protein VI386_30710 [Candidatus Sulfotelmatobacter sp.]
MKFVRICVLGVLCVSALKTFALDREAFAFTNYDLNVRVEPDQKRLAVRGRVTLRNDSQVSQKIAVLQISSSLDWRSVRAGDAAVQYVSQPYTSDIDHTGALSEAIVTLPQAVAPQQTINLDLAYEGVVPLDSTRLIRIGTPESVANSTDWDQIGEKFTALRGIGYVAWYPIATEAANLSEDSLFEVSGRWKRREAGSVMHIRTSLTGDSDVHPVTLLNGVRCLNTTSEAMGRAGYFVSDCKEQRLRWDAPTLIIANYSVLERSSIEVLFLSGHDSAAAAFADAAEGARPLIAEWFGPIREKAKAADLPVRDAAPFESGAVLLTPMAGPDTKSAGLAIAHQLTHSTFLSSRPWIEEGLAHFAQVLYLEQQKGRAAALDYMGMHRFVFGGAEQSTILPRSDDEANRSLVNTTNEDLYRSKAMCVWWMLRDMLGDPALKKALAAYKPEQDKEPSYMPKLIQAQSQRDLEWFFDDWVYRDLGLPDFKVESAFARKTMTDVYILTITVDNLGAAGAEVPVVVKYAGGVVSKRLEIRGKSKAVTRVEVTGLPQEVVVNDGSVPESDVTNNSFKIEVGANSN